MMNPEGGRLEELIATLDHAARLAGGIKKGSASHMDALWHAAKLLDELNVIGRLTSAEAEVDRLRGLVKVAWFTDYSPVAAAHEWLDFARQHGLEEQ